MDMYPKGTTIRNVRQLSILSDEEISQIADSLGTESVMDPRSMGASMVVRGIPDFSHLPPNSRLVTQSGTTVTIGACALRTIDPTLTLCDRRMRHDLE
jgi:hypothetical protein